MSPHFRRPFLRLGCKATQNHFGISYDGLQFSIVFWGLLYMANGSDPAYFAPTTELKPSMFSQHEASVGDLPLLCLITRGYSILDHDCLIITIITIIITINHIDAKYRLSMKSMKYYEILLVFISSWHPFSNLGQSEPSGIWKCHGSASEAKRHHCRKPCCQQPPLGYQLFQCRVSVSLGEMSNFHGCKTVARIVAMYRQYRYVYIYICIYISLHNIIYIYIYILYKYKSMKQ